LKVAKHILPIIVVAQFCCTSLWFAGNGVIHDLAAAFDLESSALGHLTSAVQLGFIAGTLAFALLTIADRFPPSKIFFTCAVLGAVLNLGTLIDTNTILSLLALKFLIGFFLAGIYPIGMKIAADYFDKGLGRSLGFLVGALVLGTAFPHFLRGFTAGLPWKTILVIISTLSGLGGLLILWGVPKGPYYKRGSKPQLEAFIQVFKAPSFRAAAFGYFGHMWELYAFWAFVPVLLATYTSLHPGTSLNIPIASFVIIGSGSLGCIVGGMLAHKLGTRKIAGWAIFLSGLCCLLSPLMILYTEPLFLTFFLVFWGMVVVADSPLFSTLVAQNAPPHLKGTALTLVNCIGFSVTIFSIQLLTHLHKSVHPGYIYLVLAIGPALGLLALYQSNVRKPST